MTKEYKAMITDLLNSENSAERKLGKEMSQSAWSMENYEFFDGDGISAADIAGISEEVYGCPATEWLGIDEDSELEEAVHRAVHEGWIRVFYGDRNIVSFWVDNEC